MAHKKGVGSSRNGRDSQPKMRGVKMYDGEVVNPGHIIIRQCGTKVRPGVNVGLGRDFTIYSLVPGRVKFGWARKGQKNVSVIPLEA
ncbi:MAG TPA: 50S ribosomal protein L27 [Armatimonadota bacterium]|jgi:large subunit ribosomal protein L27